MCPASKKVTTTPAANAMRLAVSGDAAEAVAGVERVEQTVERNAVSRVAPARVASRLLARLLFLQMGGVEHHQPRQFARRAGGDDLAAEAALVQQRNASAMIEMRVCEQQRVNRRGVEAERRSVLVVEVAAALEEAAIDENALAAGLDEMARAGDVAVGAVERDFHDGCAPGQRRPPSSSIWTSRSAGSS